MSIVKPKTNEGKMPSSAYVNFNGQVGKISLEIEMNGEKKKFTPAKLRYLVVDEDFTEIGGIKMGADQSRSVKSNVCYGMMGRYFKVRLRDGTNIGAGPWLKIKQNVELYGGKLISFSFVLLQKVQGTTDDAGINAILAKNETLAKVSYHGNSAWDYGQLQKTHSTNDMAGFSILVDGFYEKTSPKTGLKSQVPIFKAERAPEGSPLAVAGVSAFLSKVEPYIKYVKGGGTMGEVEAGDAPEASADDFPEGPPAEEEKAPVTDDLPF